MNTIQKRKLKVAWRQARSGIAKAIIAILVVVTLFLLLARLTRYQERMEYINRHQCAVWGYYEDCKTPLKK
jgi:hypothetical protein